MNHDDSYYLMPANYAKAFIPGLYRLAQDSIKNGLSNADKPAIAEGTHNLVNKIKELADDSDFRMSFSDCVLMYGIMVKVKIMFHTVKAKIEYGKENTQKEEVRSLFHFSNDIQRFIDSVMDDLCETFPDFRPEVARFQNDLRKLELSFRKMDVDNEDAVIRFYLKEEIERKFFLLIFQMFDLAVLKIEYEFSKSVREAGFFYESDFTDVFEKLKKAMGEEATDGEETTELDLTLRDAIVVYTASNITQKLFLTDAGDDIMVIFNRVSVEIANGMSATDLRSLYLQMAARINEAIEEGAIDEETFVTYIEPVKEFSI